MDKCETLDSGNVSEEKIKPRNTASGIPVKIVYTPEDIKDLDYTKELNDPGKYPFTRGLYASGYREFAWGQRPVLGYGLPEDTNKRIKYLLKYGMVSPGGLPSYSITMDMPTAFGYDSDDPRIAQWVGLSGPPCNSIKDMEATIEGIPLEGVYAGILGYAPPWRLAHYVAMADNRGVPRAKLTGAILGDSLHGRIGDGVHVFPPRACLRLIADTMKFIVEQVPNFRACDIQGYSSREAGCNAIQEVAFCISDAIEVINACLAIGLDIDAIASRITFFFAGYSDFFEEIAKFRAARKVWAQVMSQRFKAKKSGNLRMRFMVKTSASTLPAQHPLLNIARSNLQAVSAILGGANALFITAFDESYGSPTEQSARIALLSGKVLEHETGIADVTDPLGGSYYVEHLTREMEKAIWAYIEKIDAMGGYVTALENGYLQREIELANAQYSHDIDSGKKIWVGVNKYQPEKGEEYPVEVFRQDPVRVVKVMTNRLQRLRAERDNGRVKEVLAKLKEASLSGGHIVPIMVEASKAYCTVAEVYGVFKKVWGVDDQCLIPLQ